MTRNWLVVGSRNTAPGLKQFVCRIRQFASDASEAAYGATEVLVELRNAPPVVFAEAAPKRGNYIRFRLSPTVAVAIGAPAKRGDAFPQALNSLRLVPFDRSAYRVSRSAGAAARPAAFPARREAAPRCPAQG